MTQNSRIIKICHIVRVHFSFHIKIKYVHNICFSNKAQWDLFMMGNGKVWGGWSERGTKYFMDSLIKDDHLLFILPND